MYFVLLLVLSVLKIVSGANETFPVRKNGLNKTFNYNTYKYNTTIHITVNDTTEQILDFYEDSDLWHGYPTRVHVSSNDTITGEYPLFITATQQKGVASWELPLVVVTKSGVVPFKDVSRTLCPHDAGPNITSVNRPSLQVSTFSPRNLTAAIKVRRVTDFYIEVDKEVEVLVKPSTPKYYYFSFDASQNLTFGAKRYLPKFNYTIPKSIILMIESDDEICATISIQNNSCPVFDNERDVLYQGYHLTMTTKGGITLTQSMFPQGFYVVFIVRERDDVCSGDVIGPTEGGNGTDRTKRLRFKVVATISYKEYVIGALVLLSVCLLVAALVALLPLFSCRCSEEFVEEIIADAPGPSTSQAAGDAAAGTSKWDDADSLSDSVPEWEGALTQPLTLAGLSRAAPGAHSRRLDRYFWSSLTVAVVYALPVVQLLFTYQRMVFSTGDQDLCYYNFLCAHPLGVLADFNHVYSNAGYVALGAVFMLQVRRRGRDEKGVGIPQHRGLFYSMGLALGMEGVLSACYHLCPNKMNFQFDSSFMYVIAVLCMVKIYQSRHPDLTAHAHATFMLLATIMAIGLFGIMYPSVYFWAGFTVLHLGACLVLTLKIYYMGQFKIEKSVFGRSWRLVVEHGRAAFRPNYTARAVLLALANIANWALAIYGLYQHNKDFARHLLAILMGNTFLYTTFYVCMKLLHAERLRPHTWLYMVATVATWAGATVLFLDSRTKWSQTPAQSRVHNAPCSALQFYDTHDAWHLASAAAMFLYFNMLLTLDDALKHTPRSDIPVF